MSWQLFYEFTSHSVQGVSVEPVTASFCLILIGSQLLVFLKKTGEISTDFDVSASRGQVCLRCCMNELCAIAPMLDVSVLDATFECTNILLWAFVRCCSYRFCLFYCKMSVVIIFACFVCAFCTMLTYQSCRIACLFECLFFCFLALYI